MARTPFKLKSGNSTPFKAMGSSPAKGLLGDKWRDAKSTVKRAGKKAIAVGAGAKAFIKEALGGKDYHMGSGGSGAKDPAWEAEKAYNKKRSKQKATGEFGLKKSEQTSGPKEMSPAARQKQLDAMRKRAARDKAAKKKK